MCKCDLRGDLRGAPNMRYLHDLVTTSIGDIESAIYAATRAVVGDAQLGTSALVEAIRDRSARYTSDRAKLAKPASPKADLAARAVFFTIADAPKIAIPIAELASRGVLPAARPLRVVDLGAGCGAMSLGLIAALDAPMAITAIDRDREALGIAANAVRTASASAASTSDTSTSATPTSATSTSATSTSATSTSATSTSATSTSATSTSATSTSATSTSATSTSTTPTITFSTRVDDAGSIAIPSCDLVVMGTLLNELPTDAARLALVERAMAAIGDDGAVIVIEPALRETTRALHVLRDAVIGRNKAHVFAPCTRQGAPCPALADPTDWCHEHRSVKLPPRTAELARLTHLRDDGLKFSYLVLRKHALSIADNAWRIVGSPWQQKGKLEVLACSNTGRVPLRLLKRNRATGNRAIENVAKGHVVRIDPPIEAPVDERVEITDETRVQIEFPPSD